MMPRGPGAYLATAAVLAVVYLTVACSGDGAETKTTAEKPLSRASSNSLAVLNAETAKIVHAIPTGSGAASVAADGENVWVANFDEGTITIVDRGTNKRTGTIDMGGQVEDLAVAGGKLWAAVNRGDDVARVVGVNPPDRPGTELEVGKWDIPDVVGGPSLARSPVSLAGSEDALWVVNAADSTLWQIDPRASEVVAKTKIFAKGTRAAVGGTGAALVSKKAFPLGIAVGEGGVWVAESDTGAQRTLVVRIDATALKATKVIAFEGRPTGIAVGEGAVWIADRQQHQVVRIDPASNSVTARIPVSARPSSIAVGGGSVWVMDSVHSVVTRIDPGGNAVVAEIEVGKGYGGDETFLTDPPHSIAVSEAVVWTTVQY